MPARPPAGLHHITCVCNAWQETTAFYRDLGFHLVKNTVNHDAPTTRHVYYADESGTPGTTLTFFEWPSPRRGQPGFQSAQHVGLDLPAGIGLDQAATVADGFSRPTSRGNDVRGPCVETQDPDGLRLRLYEGTGDGPRLAHAGLYGAVDDRLTFFADALGFKVDEGDGHPPRVLAPDGETILLLLDGADGPGRMDPGAVHHVAFLVDDQAHQEALAQRLREAGHETSDPIDRVYFRSVYTRDPGGHILELATPGPGFSADEAEDALGQTLVLPEWLEADRERIEKALSG